VVASRFGIGPSLSAVLRSLRVLFAPLRVRDYEPRFSPDSGENRGRIEEDPGTQRGGKEENPVRKALAEGYRNHANYWDRLGFVSYQPAV